MTTAITFETAKHYDQRHGGPFDRGSADSYYGRLFNPHCYVGATSLSTRVDEADMSAADIEAYTVGYEWNEQYGDKKDYG
jgi:hypothetical protein